MRRKPKLPSEKRTFIETGGGGTDYRPLTYRKAREIFKNRPLRIHDSQGTARSSRDWRALAMPWKVGRCIGLDLPLKPDSN